MTIRYTSAREMGQIYMPAVNWALLAGVIAAVLFFGSSSALAGAYGIAVTLTMMITTMLTYFVVRKAWQLPAPVAIGATAFFLAIDALLVAGCAVKFFDGGWFPLALGLLLFGVMSTWSRGRARLVQAIRRDGLELQSFIDGLDPRSLNRAERTAVYAVADPTTVPQALLHNLKHNQVLHVRNVILTVVFHEVPWIPMDRRVQVAPLGHGFWRVTLNFGFMNTPDVPAALELTQSHGLHIPVFETSYFLSREAVVPTPGGGMANRDDPQRGGRGRVLPAAKQRRGRARHAGADLSWSAAFCRLRGATGGVWHHVDLESYSAPTRTPTVPAIDPPG
jgi:KUP system potassium uptake protein